MKVNQITIAVIFLTGAQTAFAQKVKTDSLKSERHIEKVTLQGNTKKNSENTIISTQKKSVEIIERIGASQLSKQGIGDAAAAVTKATGTQKQEASGQIFVRGLGDRYNTTTLNGLPIPSDDPENKNINLSLFKTSVVEYISLNKIFSPKLNGNMTGANIDIVSRDFSGKPYLQIGLSEGINLQTFSRNFYRQQGGPGYSGFHTEKLRASETPEKINPFRSGWNFLKTELPMSFGINAEGGTNFNFQNGQRLSVFGYASFSNDYSYRKGKEGIYSSTGDLLKEFQKVDRYTYTTNTTGLLNLIYRLSSNSRIGFTTDFIHNSGQDFKTYYGNMREVANEQNLMIKRGENKITSTWINQLFGNHRVMENWQLDWALGYNNMNSQRPNVLQNTVIVENPQSPMMYNIMGPQNFRYFDKLTNRSYTGYLHLSRYFGLMKLSFGYDGSFENRDFKNTFVNVGLQDATVTNPDDLNQVYENNLTNNDIRYTNVGGVGLFNYYYFKNRQQIHSGFLNADYQFSERLTIQIGARFDHISIDNEWLEPLDGYGSNTKDYNKILPAFNLKYILNDRNNLRFAASKTYTLPQAKELMPIPYFDVTYSIYGNPNLKISDSYNADLKWEFFPKQGELISIGIFGKYIIDPISKSVIASASNDYTYLNIANWAYAYGAEVELRKNIAYTENGKFYTFSNLSFLKSRQSLKTPTELSEDNNQIADFTNKTEKLQGASDLLANVNLGYSIEWMKSNSDFVLSYSYTGKTLDAIGIVGTGNFFGQPVHDLGATWSINLKDKYGFSLKAANLLNPKYKIIQKNPAGSFINNSYNKGAEISLGFNYKF